MSTPVLQTNLVTCQFRFNTGDCLVNDRSANEYGELERMKFKDYVYKLVDGVVVQPGDAVVVYGSTGFQVAQVIEVNATTPTMDASGLIISRVDMDGFRNHVNNQKHMKEMRNLIDAKKRELERTLTYEMLAERDAGFAALLQEFKARGGRLG